MFLNQKKPRTFSKVATMGNTFTTKVKETEDEEEKLQVFKAGIHNLIKEIIGVSFEKSEILDLIANNPKFQPLQYYDPTSVFRQDMDSLQMGQVLSLIASVQNTVDKLETKADGSPELINRLEKVKYDKLYYIGF